VGELGVPVAYGLKSGHVSRRNFTLPLGVQVTLRTGDTVSLSLAASVKKTTTAVASAKS
jgi:muramoyltetrapeptide carboxypeptidase LdcA involved in peptidoglycan recycling